MSSQQRPVVDSLQSSDHIYVYDNLNGFTAVASLATLISFLNGKIVVSDGKVTQYAAPTFSGEQINLPTNSQNTWLVITPTGPFGDLYIQLPDAASSAHNQEITITITQDVTTLDVFSEGGSTFGVPTSVTTVDGAFSFTVRFEAILKSWYRVD